MSRLLFHIVRINDPVSRQWQAACDKQTGELIEYPSRFIAAAAAFNLAQAMGRHCDAHDFFADTANGVIIGYRTEVFATFKPCENDDDALAAQEYLMKLEAGDEANARQN